MPLGRGEDPRPTVVLCGEDLSRSDRDALAERFADGSGDVALSVVEKLCAKPERVTGTVKRGCPSVVILACDLDSAQAAAVEAAHAGLDGARIATGSIAATLREPTTYRSRRLAALCYAMSRRALSLATEPLAGHEPLRWRESMDRRALFHLWQAPPRRGANVDETRCLGASKCNACVVACPKDAWGLVDDVRRVNSLACTSCGTCVLACPVGAITMPGADLEGLAVQFEALLAEGFGSFELTCAHVPELVARPATDSSSEPRINVQLPGLSMLGSGILLGLLARGARLSLRGCSSCQGDAALQVTLGYVGRTLVSLSREDLNGRLTVEWQPDEERGRAAPLAFARSDEPLQWREPMATYAALSLINATDHVAAAGVTLLDDDAPSALVRVDPTFCSGCGACALACPTTAISVDQEGGRLVVDPTHCVGCGRCAEVCPEQAVRVTRGVDLAQAFEYVVGIGSAEAEWPCVGCGAAMHDTIELASVLRRLSAKGANSELLSALRRCPTCRASSISSVFSEAGEPT